MKHIKDAIVNNSLWLIGLGLMLASSGIDGAYMSQWMPPGWEWLGLVLNTMADIGGMVLMYWFGRLRQDRSKAKRQLAYALLASEIVSVVYSWGFSYLQLRRVLVAVEGDEAEVVAFFAAGFIPLLLAFVGYAQALLEGRIVTPKASQQTAQTAQQVPQNVPTSAATDVVVTLSDAAVTLKKPQFDAWIASLNGERDTLTRKDVLDWAESRGLDVSTATGKAARDKVLRWCRGAGVEVLQ